jgi:hypothetical protein
MVTIDSSLLETAHFLKNNLTIREMPNIETAREIQHITNSRAIKVKENTS